MPRAARSTNPEEAGRLLCKPFSREHMRDARAQLAMALYLTMVLGAGARAVEIVKDGQPMGAVWHQLNDPCLAPPGAAPAQGQDAVTDLVTFIRRISGAELPVKAVAKGERPPDVEPAIVVGQLALDMGLAPPPKTVSADGYSIQTKGNHLLLAGEAPLSTRFAVSHYLEHLGCRWLMAGKWGEIIPQSRTLSLDGLDAVEKPDFLYREIWGYVDRARWKGGGLDLPNRHDWEHCPPEKYFKDHPEYFALRGGQRRPSNWVCTSNPDVVRIFADAYIAKAKTGVKADTISPPDGRGFCECDKCKALDVPGYIEPSNGALAMSDRFARFFEAVGTLVKKDAPGFILSFYCYSDYTLPPKTLTKVSDNLCGWVTTIRFCRIHGVNNPNCESRQRYRQVVEGWAKLMQTACYDYNYNLAEVTVPISKITYMKENIPYLKKTGCLGINLESMACWNLYGPHTYLAGKLMWHADADPDAILADYYEKCVGKAAAPHLKSYWDRIDKAVTESKAHCGSFYGLHAIWTPALVTACEADLDAAARAAGTDAEKERVALFRSGLESAKFWLALRDQINRCDFAKAKELFDRWLAHMDDAFAKQYNTMGNYKRGYADRFLQAIIQSGLGRTTGECKRLLQLPDEWDFRYDPQDAGEKEQWFKADLPPDGWQKVKTYTATLDEQGVPEQLTWMWYRTRVAVPKDLPPGPLHLWFGEVDGSPTRVYLNGEFLAELAGARQPIETEVTGKLKPGEENLVVVKTGHLGISELKLGGILRPVMIYSGPRPELPVKK